ncbi:MAG TPA: hypothetical protein VFB12_18485 [Ktedonobacteraceae bacterium]|nr:hypothetical protein [Ktedonobacteraceae bacterium]
MSRFLASVDRPCLEAFRQLFEQHSFAEGWTSEAIGGIWDRQGRRYIVFDVDATRQAAQQRALPCDPTLPPLDAASMRSMRQATTGENVERSSAHGRSLSKCIPDNGSAPTRAEAMAIINACWLIHQPHL